MTSALYLEHYLDSLEHLPVELQRNFNLMKDLDTRAQTLMRNIDALSDNYLKKLKTLSSEAKSGQMITIQNLFSKAKEYGDDKVQLAIQTYELVDKHIRRLDSDLARFESEIQDKALNSRANEEIQAKKSNKKKDKIDKKKNRSSDEDSSSTTKSQRKKLKKGQTVLNSANKNISTVSNILEDVPGSVLPALAANLHAPDVLDMPVDPNEPTYCLCHQVSYGEMIGCDNPDCPIEWFHFACVGLVTKPKGKWYCPKCIVDRKKK